MAETDANNPSRIKSGAFLVLMALLLGLWRTEERGLFTAHEARAARVARNMLRAGDWPAGAPSPWVVPQASPDTAPGLNYEKPPLYYWAVALASLPGGEVTPLTARLPSAVSLALLVLTVFAFGCAIAGQRAGLLAALVLLATPKVLWWGRAAILDPMLAACVAGSLLFFARAHFGRGGRWQYWLFWGLAGLGTLVKATSLVVPLMAVGAYLVIRAREDGLWRPLWRLKPISGPLVLLAVAAPWHVAAHLATAGEFSTVYWGRHVFGRATGSGGFEEQTAWWYYLMAMVRDLFPWIVLLPGALVQPWRRASREDRPRLLLPWVWFLTALVFFSAVPFRKDEYMLVAYPAAALLIGYFLECYIAAGEEGAALGPWVRVALWGVAGAGVATGVLLAAAGLSEGFRLWVARAFDMNQTDRVVLAALGDAFAGRGWLLALVAGPLAVGSLAAAIMAQAERRGAAFLSLVLASLLAFITFTTALTPLLNRVRSLGEFAGEVRALAAREGEGTRVLLAVGESHEMAYELGDALLLESIEVSVPQFLERRLEAGERWLMVTDRRLYRDYVYGSPRLTYERLGQTRTGHRRPMVVLRPVLKAAPGEPARGPEA